MNIAAGFCCLTTASYICLFVSYKGCFDILHPGHIDLLTKAKALGNHLTVGLIAILVGRIKARSPRLRKTSVAHAVALESVDEVVFLMTTPER